MVDLAETYWRSWLLAHERLETTGRFAGRHVAVDANVASYLIQRELGHQGQTDLEEIALVHETLQQQLLRWTREGRLKRYDTPNGNMEYVPPEGRGPWYRPPED